MKTILIICLLLNLSLQIKWHQLDDYTFNDYLNEYQKNYGEDEYQMRKNIFDANLQNIKSHNIQIDQTYKKGVNQFTDKTQQELQAYLGFQKVIDDINENVNYTLVVYNSTEDLQKLQNLPTTVDWRQAGVITPVKDQGNCGSCWAFTTVEQIESYLAINTGYLTELSVGEIVACTQNPNECGGSGGCNGATIRLGTQYVIDNGLTSEWKVPYQSYFGITPNCSEVMYQNNQNATQWIKQNKVYVQTNARLLTNSYNDIMFHLAYVGPLGIGVASADWFQYEEGVYNGCSNYENVTLDHAVQLIGYGTDEKYGDYFLIRNSWSSTFGENGYIRLNRNTKCGTDLSPQQNTECIKLGQNYPQQVCGQCGLLFSSDFPINVTLSLNNTNANSTNSTNSSNKTNTKNQTFLNGH